ncbi:MAG: hypothetical protein ACLRIS_10990 [Flavonifractor plautii]
MNGGTLLCVVVKVRTAIAAVAAAERFNTGNGGITTLPSFPELPVFPGGGTAANTRWPVYVSFPAFLWDTAGGEDEDSSCGCGCCRG